MADRSFAGQLSRESEAWVAEGLVSAEQAAAIRRQVRRRPRGAARQRNDRARRDRRGRGRLRRDRVRRRQLGGDEPRRPARAADGGRRRLVRGGVPPPRPDREQAPGRRGALPARRAPLRRLALPRRSDVQRRGARPAGAPALGGRSDRDGARRPLARDRRRCRPHLHELGRLRVRARARRRRLQRSPRSRWSRSSTAARSTASRPTAQERIREHWFAGSGFPESGRGVGLAGRGGRTLRLHLLRCGQGARTRGRGAGRLPARGASAPGRARARRLPACSRSRGGPAAATRRACSPP